MAVIKIFPEKSATLYSYYPTLNSGIDEILELSTYKTLEGTYEVSRPIIKFSQSEINDILLKVSSSAFSASLKLYTAYTSQIPLNYSIYCYPLSSSWNIGTGRFSNSPITTDGVSWKYTDTLSGSIWFNTGSFPTGTTGSYKSGSNIGGGLWYTASNYEYSQSFVHTSNSDIDIDITNIVQAWSGSIINNEGIILKNSNILEFNTSSYFELKYFSENTHTIYPPCLEIKWDDSIYNTGSLSIVSSSNIVLTIDNNKSEYQQDSIQRFKINVRDKFPVRTFQTSSVYLNNKLLPSSSYWSIKDLDTEEIIIDFSNNFTKISADSTGNYFNVYCNGLEPRRYYKILVKTVFNNGEVVIFDNNYFFKIID